MAGRWPAMPKQSKANSTHGEKPYALAQLYQLAAETE
jgi:hypothetical protein